MKDTRSSFDWIKNHQRITGALLLFLLITGIAIHRWIAFSSNIAPPGSDGGQWLAFAHQLFGGEQVKAGFQSYPPIFPFLVRIFPIEDSLLTLKVLGIASSVIVCIPVCLLLRTVLNPLLSAVLAATTVIGPYNYEVLCFGGYPQLLGTFFLVLSAFLLLKGMDTGSRKWFLGSSVAAAATAGSNALPTLMLVVTSGFIVTVFSYRFWNKERSLFYERSHSIIVYWIFPATVLSIVFIPTYFDYLASSGSVNSKGLSIIEILRWMGESWRWEFVLWLGIINVAAVAFISNPSILSGRNLLLSTGTIALLFAGLTGIIVMRELRCLAFIEIGVILLLGLLLPSIIGSFQRPSVKFAFAIFSLAFVISIVSVVGTLGDRRLDIAYNWYDVIDESVLPAMDWLDANSIPNAKVVASGASGGHNFGWWIEGYAHMPTYAATDISWFIDEEERAQVALAHHILVEGTSPEEIRILAGDENISFLFLDKRVIKTPLENYVQAGFNQSFETDTIIVMKWNGSLLSQNRQL